MTINVIVLTSSFAAGILVDYLINKPASAMQRSINALQWGVMSLFFGVLTPNEATNIALLYLVTPTAFRLLGHASYRPVEKFVTKTIGRMYLSGERKITPARFVLFLLNKRGRR